MTTPRDAYIIALVDAHPGDTDAGPANVRVRRALKCLLRSFGLRCVRAEFAPVPSPGRLGEAFAPLGTPDAADARPGPSAGEG